MNVLANGYDVNEYYNPFQLLLPSSFAIMVYVSFMFFNCAFNNIYILHINFLSMRSNS